MSDPLVVDIPGLVRWSVPEGVSVVIGPNGSGKTRLCGALLNAAEWRGQLRSDKAARKLTAEAFPCARPTQDAQVNAAHYRFTGILRDSHEPYVIDDVEMYLDPHAVRVLMRALAESEGRVVVTTHSPVVLNCRDVERDQIWVLDRRAPAGIVNLDTRDEALRTLLGWPCWEWATHFTAGDLWANEEIGRP